MADIWDRYIQQNGFAPKTAQQLLNFSKSVSDVSLTFKQANEIFDQHKTKPVVTNQNKPVTPRSHQFGVPPGPSASNQRPSPSPGQGAVGYQRPPGPHNAPMNPSAISIDPLKNEFECQRQTDIFSAERQELHAIQLDHEHAYNAQIEDMDAQFTAMMEAIQRRQNDLRKWRKQEYDEGLQCIERASQIIQRRVDELQSTSLQLVSSPDDPATLNSVLQTLANVPKCDGFQLTRFTPQSLQIQTVINNVFMLGPTYQQNAGNKTVISLRGCNQAAQNMPQVTQVQPPPPQDKRALDLSASPFGAGKIMAPNNATHNSGTPNGGNVTQKNGTRQLQFDQSAAAGGLRAFDTGNNAKYASLQNMTPTNVLPTNFWEDNDTTDSEEERRETQDQVAQRWKQQKSNIEVSSKNKFKRKKQPKKPLPLGSSLSSNAEHEKVRRGTAMTQTPNVEHALLPKTGGGGHHKRARSVYDKSSSDEDDGDNAADDEEEDDGFEKYVPPPPSQSEVAAAKEQKRREEEEYWKHNDTVWIVQELGKQFEYDTVFFGVPKMRNGKTNGLQMKGFMEKSGLSKEVLKQIWKLSDLDKDGKMGNEEFALCVLLMEKAKNGESMPATLPKNYIPPSFRGKKLVKTPPKKPRSLTTVKSMPPSMHLGGDASAATEQDQRNVSPSGFVITPKPKTRLSSKTTVSVSEMKDLQINLRTKENKTENG